MIVTVSGWRHWADTQFVINRLRSYGYEYGHALYWRVGDCRTGVDMIVRRWLVEQNVPRDRWTVYHADWKSLGDSAGPIRNGQMLRGEANPSDPNPDVVTTKLLALPEPGVRMRSPGSGTVGCLLDAHLLGVGIDIPGYRIN